MTPLRILVFHIGHLGDTVMSLPSLHALRSNFSDVELTFFSDKVLRKNYVLGASLFQHTDLFRQIITFPKITNRFLRFINPIFLMMALPKLRRLNFDTVAYLVPSLRRPAQIQRDKRYFYLAGIRQFYGFEGFAAEKQKSEDQNGTWQHEAEAILHRLQLDGLRVPEKGEAEMDLLLSGMEKKEVDSWFNHKGTMHVSRPMVGFGPGSKMQAKKWPKERFIQVGRRLIKSHGIWPVVFGGPEDKNIGDELLAAWQRGYNAAGDLGLRHAAEALSRCSLYLGNDTGTMHLAAAVSTSCVAIFSARDLKGKWYPYGNHHTLLRKNVKCAGCKLEFCEHKTCLMEIAVDEVVQAAESKLTAQVF